MNNLETYDPHLAQKLERRAAKVAEYELWFWRNCAVERHVCETIEKARGLWVTAALGEWDRWELQENGTITKKGVF